MPRKRTAPTTFDGWLGSVVEGLIDKFGGRPAAALKLNVSEKTIQRKIAGTTPLTVSELEQIADLVRLTAAEMVRTALTQYGDGDQDAGLRLLMSEAKCMPEGNRDVDLNEEELRKQYDLAAQEQDSETDPTRNDDPASTSA